jgi:hypothetical protein
LLRARGNSEKKTKKKTKTWEKKDGTRKEKKKRKKQKVTRSGPVSLPPHTTLSDSHQTRSLSDSRLSDQKIERGLDVPAGGNERRDNRLAVRETHRLQLLDLRCIDHCGVLPGRSTRQPGTSTDTTTASSGRGTGTSASSTRTPHHAAHEVRKCVGTWRTGAGAGTGTCTRRTGHVHATHSLQKGSKWVRRSAGSVSAGSGRGA